MHIHYNGLLHACNQDELHARLTISTSFIGHSQLENISELSLLHHLFKYPYTASINSYVQATTAGCPRLELSRRSRALLALSPRFSPPHEPAPSSHHELLFPRPHGTMPRLKVHRLQASVQHDRRNGTSGRTASGTRLATTSSSLKCSEECTSCLNSSSDHRMFSQHVDHEYVLTAVADTPSITHSKRVQYHHDFEESMP